MAISDAALAIADFTVFLIIWNAIHDAWLGRDE